MKEKDRKSWQGGGGGGGGGEGEEEEESTYSCGEKAGASETQQVSHEH